MLVDIHKDLGHTVYYPYSVLIDSGATYIIITKSINNKLRLETVRAKTTKIKKKAHPLTTRANGEQLHATTVVRQMVRMCISTKTKWSYAMNFVVADDAHYDMILSMAWLWKENPHIHWNTGV